MELNKYLQKKRVERHLTVRELAILAGISPSEMTLIENGDIKTPQPATLKKLSEALHCSYSELYDLSERNKK